MTNKTRVILDTDANNEIDDQHAIAYLLFNGDVFDVEGITVNRTHHGGDIDAHYREAARVLQLAGLHGSIPLLKGASGSFDSIAGRLDAPDFDGHAAVDFIIKQARADDPRPLVLIPVGKLTNVALALRKAPDIAHRVRIVWLGSNWPDPGEYNFDNDPASVQVVLDCDVPFEMVVVRPKETLGTQAVTVATDEVRRRLAGQGPQVVRSVEGREGGQYRCFGNYSVALLSPFTERPLHDVVAVALVKNPTWGRRREIPAPQVFEHASWQARPDNSRTISVWDNFDRHGVIEDFFASITHPVVVSFG